MLAAIRQWVIKTMMKGQTGVVRTLPKQEIIELNTQITAEKIMRNGINPEDLKTVDQVENVVEQIEQPKVNVNPGMTSVKKADVMDMEGNKIPDGAKIMGGKEVPTSIDQESFLQRVNKAVQENRESDAAIKARLDADNKKGIAGIKNNRMLNDDEIADLADEVGELDAYDFDGTIGSANKIKKERAAYIRQMELEYKKGNLDPEPGSGTSQRKRFLQKKLNEAEQSGDSRLISKEEREELFDLDDVPEYADGGRIGLKGGTFLNFIKNIGKGMNNKSPVQAYKDYLKSVKDRAQKGDMKTLAPELGIIAGGGILTNRFLKKKLEKMTEDAKAEVEKKADGGRIGFFKGAQADTKKGKSMSPGTTASGGFRGGGNNNDDGPSGPPRVINPPPKDNKPPIQTTDNKIVERLKAANTSKLSPFKKFLAHDRFTDLLKESKIPNYHQLGGFDFMARFPDTNPDVAKGLASAYQTIFEGGRAIADGPGGVTFEDAGKKAAEESRLNAVGIDAFSDPNSETYKTYSEGLIPEIMGNVKMADGGRIGLKGGMTKRAFMKLMGGVGASIGAAKSGIFSGFGKGAGKTVAKEVAQQTTSGMPPPYFFKLAEKIKMMGDDVTATTDRTIAKSLKSKDGKSEYFLEEDMASGDTIIKKINKEGDEMITDIEIMELKKGEVVQGKDGKPVRVPDEYEEVTEANARIDGDVFNDPYYSDGIKVDEIIKEVDDKVPSIKYASGGLAYMLGE